MWPHASRVAIFGHHHSGIVGLTTCEINHLSESPLPAPAGAWGDLVSRRVTTTDRWPCRGASASHTASLHARQMPQHDSGLVPPGRLWVHDGETCMDVSGEKGIAMGIRRTRVGTHVIVATLLLSRAGPGHTDRGGEGVQGAWVSRPWA